MLGYISAKRVVELERKAFFGDLEFDLPRGRSSELHTDDLTPQFGFVGTRYPESLVLLIGINPGNARRNDFRTKEDAEMMPAMIRFFKEPTEDNFAKASMAYKAQCQKWPIWKQHCSEVIGAGPHWVCPLICDTSQAGLRYPQMGASIGIAEPAKAARHPATF